MSVAESAYGWCYEHREKKTAQNVENVKRKAPLRTGL
jgi:hypothetical protein